MTTEKKVWGILQETPKHQLSSINFFLDENFLLDEIIDESTFGLEAIVCPSHFIFSPEDAI